MELYETNSPLAERLAKKANELRLPLGGTIELTPICNMSCKMCYIHQSDKSAYSNCKLLSANQWLDILQEAKENGVLYLLITGGEPLLYPEFKELYKKIIKLGFLVTMNTNATLINEEWADFFARYRCHGFNISLYGKDDATYNKICGNPNGFTQVTKSLDLLKERNLPFILTTSLVEENMEQMKELYEIAKSYNVTYKPSTYMFPAIRRGIHASEQYRLSPQTAARRMFEFHKLRLSQTEFDEFVRRQLLGLYLPPRISIAKGKEGYPCRGGKSGFWINWKGELTSCVMLESPSMSLLNHSFSECWNHIVSQTKKIEYCETCLSCHKQNICHICPAITYSETGSMTKCPEYVCDYTNELIKCLLECVPEEQKNSYLEALQQGGLQLLF